MSRMLRREGAKCRQRFMEMVDKFGPDAVCEAMAQVSDAGGKPKRGRKRSRRDAGVPF